MAGTAATITMSMREVDRVKTVQAVVDRMLPAGVAARRLGLSRRQLERLVLRYKAQGASGLVSAKRGRPSNLRGMRHAAGGQVCTEPVPRSRMRHFYLAGHATSELGLDRSTAVSQRLRAAPSGCDRCSLET